MYTKKDLLRNLSEIGVDSFGTLMVHISCKAVGEVEGRGDAILDLLVEYMRPGLLVLPSHTWNNQSRGKQNPHAAVSSLRTARLRNIFKT